MHLQSILVAANLDSKFNHNKENSIDINNDQPENQLMLEGVGLAAVKG